MTNQAISSPAPRLNRPGSCVPMVSLRCGTTFGGLSTCVTGRFRAVNSRKAMSLQGREENSELPPDSSHPASQVPPPRVDRSVQNRAARR